MNRLKIYGHPYRAADASIKQPTITVAAQHPFRHYSDYLALRMCVSTTQHPSHWKTSVPHKSPSIECLHRFRRVILFLDTCNLAVQKTSNTKKTEELLRAIRHQCNLDHLSILISPVGSVFFLNEPYYRTDNENDVLKSLGLTSNEIPIPMSPYCGKWDDTKGKQPSTRSYLITDTKNAHELNHLALRLQDASLTAPAWNEMVGVGYE